MTLLSSGAAVVAPHQQSALAEGNRKYRVPVSRSMGAKDIEQTISVYSPGLSLARRNGIGEEVLYVVHGSGECYIDGHLYSIGAGVGIYIPPASIYQINNTGDDELEIIGVSCPEGSVAETDLVLPAANPSDTTPFRTVSEDQQKAIAAGDRTFKLLVSAEIGCKNVTQFVGIIPPGRAPMHYHTYEEAIYILEGEGSVHTENGSEHFAAGTSIYLPRGVSHCLENTGRCNVRLVGVFHPSGSPGANHTMQAEVEGYPLVNRRS